MTHSISNSSLFLVSEFLSANMGISFPKERWHDLTRGIAAVSLEFNHKDPESFIRWLTSSTLTKDQVGILARHFTVGETYFFRDKNVFNALEMHILPELIQMRRNTGKRLRFWSAGCATGEEPYSLAILLSKMIPDLNDWNVTILATDINPRSLKMASNGVYTKWSFRSTPEWIKKKYFTKTEDGHRKINSLIKNMVKFSNLNLMDDCYPSMINNTNTMDVIFCRNVLMYFPLEYTKKVIRRIYQAQANGGWLVISPGEMPHKFQSRFATIHLCGAILYRKGRSQVPLEKNIKTKQIPLVPEKVLDFQNNLQQQTVFLDQKDTFDKVASQPLEAPRESSKSIGMPGNSHGHCLELFENGYYGEAVESLHGLLSHNQDDTNAMILLARTYANKGNLAKAAKWCERAIQIDKLNPSFHYLLSTIMAEQGRMEDAVDALKRVLYLDYNFVIAYFSLGNINRQLGKLEESKKNFDNATSILSKLQTKEILPESGGITAGRLKEIINSLSSQGGVDD
ncbi:MCP methyltransferase, CheR-type [Desulfocicer vacuolatum DSM 3385]|uniref:MCP methyltransferase, CheR-type n=1 Tax=Desulfocicer vacuolatum DSM 3385 TaxID=1121400 RepID=A0A1W1YT77_9BACT|nr:CheR family methyltransferase [Desulfocicer vacuolatum]SMC39323.1 MCP methyltransferase, CheR-type [Desulfocicer vacuolatum DSM 3385]